MTGVGGTLVEAAPAKVNLVLQVGPRRDDGLHELCSLFASIDLADTLRFEVVDVGGVDDVRCPGVDGPNLVTSALAAFRDVAAGGLPPLRVEIEKRIPVAAGLGGGSADAAAALRAANRIAGTPLARDELARLAFGLGADVPSQLEPGHALVEGAGERVEPLELPEMALVLVPAETGLRTADVYAEADRLGSTREWLEPDRLRALAGGSRDRLAAELENDLEPAVLSLRPELRAKRATLVDAGARGASISGSGPTVFGVFGEAGAAREAAARIPGSIVALPRPVHRHAPASQ